MFLRGKAGGRPYRGFTLMVGTAGPAVRTPLLTYVAARWGQRALPSEKCCFRPKSFGNWHSNNVPLVVDFCLWQGARASRPCFLSENLRDARSPRLDQGPKARERWYKAFLVDQQRTGISSTPEAAKSSPPCNTVRANSASSCPWLSTAIWSRQRIVRSRDPWTRSKPRRVRTV